MYASPKKGSRQVRGQGGPGGRWPRRLPRTVGGTVLKETRMLIPSAICSDHKPTLCRHRSGTLGPGRTLHPHTRSVASSAAPCQISKVRAPSTCVLYPPLSGALRSRTPGVSDPPNKAGTPLSHSAPPLPSQGKAEKQHLLRG